MDNKILKTLKNLNFTKSLNNSLYEKEKSKYQKNEYKQLLELQRKRVEQLKIVGFNTAISHNKN